MKSFLDACRIPEPLQLAVEAEGARETGVRLLHQPFALIGRDERADVPLDHRLVSRRHVYLQVVEGHVFWIDLESRLGTLGSGRPRKFGWLDVDESMRIGPYEIRRLIGGRPIRRDAAHQPPPETVPLVAKTYGPSPWPEVSLEFLNGPSRAAVWPMNRVLSLVGSAGGCKFRLADPSVSPFHCSLLRTSVGLWVVDLLGSDGVAVNNASLVAVRLGQLKDAGTLTPAQVSYGKYANVRAALDVAREARTTLGGAGITLDHGIMRHMNNLETVMTYEGTEEMHLLSIGAELTGIRAFR